MKNYHRSGHHSVLKEYVGELGVYCYCYLSITILRAMYKFLQETVDITRQNHIRCCVSVNLMASRVPMYAPIAVKESEMTKRKEKENGLARDEVS